MGPHAHPDQPRRTPEVDTLRALVPDTADVIRVRAQPTVPKRQGAWVRAEVLGADQWPPNPGEPLVPLDHTADDSTHASLTVCEFLATLERAPIVRQVSANESAYVFSIQLTRPAWDGWHDH